MPTVLSSKTCHRNIAVKIPGLSTVVTRILGIESNKVRYPFISLLNSSNITPSL